MKKYNLYSKYPQCNHIHKPTLIEWVHDGSGLIDFYVDDAAKDLKQTGKKGLQSWSSRDRFSRKCMIT